MNGEYHHGICRLSMVPVRREAGDEAEMVTQLLFGDHYCVTDRSKDERWLRIRIAYDDYEGWISAKQHTHISEAYYELLSSTDFKVCTDLISAILYKKRLIQVVLGSILPISSTEIFAMEEALAFNGESKNMSERRPFEFLQQIAQKFNNAPYLWGGKTPFGVDCSGFTQQVFKICGYRLRRDAAQQFAQGQTIAKFDEHKAGDLAFFSSDRGHISHVGILLENHKIIHASGFVRTDPMTKEGIVDGHSGKITHRLAGIKRMLIQ